MCVYRPEYLSDDKLLEDFTYISQQLMRGSPVAHFWKEDLKLLVAEAGKRKLKLPDVDVA